MLQSNEDAYGQLIYAHYRGLPSVEIVERDDHWFGCSAGAPAYFAPFKKWPSAEQRAVRQIRGTVLDVGCGAGRVALHLQARGHDVVAIDISPLAVKTCLLRAVRDARICSITQINGRLGHFDTIVMFGNDFGLFGNAHRARWLLRRLHSFSVLSEISHRTGSFFQRSLPVHYDRDRLAEIQILQPWRDSHEETFAIGCDIPRAGCWLSWEQLLWDAGLKSRFASDDIHRHRRSTGGAKDDLFAIGAPSEISYSRTVFGYLPLSTCGGRFRTGRRE